MAWIHCLMGNGSGSDITYFGYAKFDGTHTLTLPFTINADYEVEVTFNAGYLSAQAVIGNTSGAGFSHLTMYNNRWYASTGNSETNFNANFTGDNTFITNRNGENLFNGVRVTSYTPTNFNANYTLGSRAGGGVNYRYYIKEYKIKSISTGDLLIHLKPALFKNTIPCLYDEVSGNLYMVNEVAVTNII